jgi:uncharacterized protein YjbI with pentapeptide repeats
VANANHVAVLKRGAETLNQWRRENPDIRLDLAGAALAGIEVPGADLSGAILTKADINNANLRGASLNAAELVEVKPRGGKSRKGRPV